MLNIVLMLVVLLCGIAFQAKLKKNILPQHILKRKIKENIFLFEEKMNYF